MAEAAFNLADWISLADVGEDVKRRNGYHDGLARGDVIAALEAGCGLMLRWVGDDGREVCREFLKRDSWEDILVWAGLPRRLCVQLPPDERKGNLPYPYAYLPRVDAVRLGLLPASELPQAKQQSKQQSEQQSREQREAASVDARASKRRRNSESGSRSGAQTLRARGVLKRLYGGPAKYPTEEEVATPDLLKRFGAEYDRVEGRADPPSTLGMPSRATVLREVGRQVD